MQVYCLITDGTHCLIPKKAIENNWWGGEISRFGPVLVNQAGQYALFGGKVEDGKDAKKAGLREVHEESGVSLDGIPLSMHKVAEKAGLYECYAVVVSPERLLSLRDEMSHNIATKNVTDGEMSSVTMVPLNEVGKYLGVDQNPTTLFNESQMRQYKDGERKRPGRHAIDWNRNIAAETTIKLAEIEEVARQHIADHIVPPPPVAVSPDIPSSSRRSW